MTISLIHLPKEPGVKLDDTLKLRTNNVEVSAMMMKNAQVSDRPYSQQFSQTKARKLGLVSPLLWLPIETDDERLQALLDTGASLNLISTELLEKLPSKPLMELAVDLQGATGRSGDLSKWHTVRLTFPNGRTLTTICLEGAPEGVELVLGMPFILQTRTVIDA